MSDLENELLGLAEDNPHRHRKRHNSHEKSKKKSKAFIDDSDDDGEADMDLESEEDADDAYPPGGIKGGSSSRRPAKVPSRNPYPLEGKYVDEDDREALEAMPEIERENILASRLEEMQKFKDSQQLDAMFKQELGGGDSDDDDGPSRKRRKHTSVTKEASRAMTDLKNKRKAKDERAQRRAARRSEKRQRSASPASDNSTEDGEISHSQSYPHRRSPSESPEYKAPSPSKESKEVDLDHVPANRQELNAARLSRYELVDMMYKDGFDEVVIGAYVRLMAAEPDERGQPKYRIHKIKEVDSSAKFGSYNIEYKGRTIRDARGLLCAYGKAARLFRIADVSNGDFEEKEFARFGMVNQADAVRAPKRSELKAKHDQIKALRDRPMTDTEINRQINSRKAHDTGANRQALLKITDMLSSEIVKLGGDPATGQLVNVAAGAGDDDYDLRIQKINENNKKKTKEVMMKAHQAALARKKAEEALIKAKVANAGVVQDETVKPAAPPTSGLRKGETAQQYVARTIELDLGDF